VLIQRPQLLARVDGGLRQSPAVALLGPRQCGKSTLARMIARGRAATIFDLEDPRDLARLGNPLLALGPLRGLIVIDEVQRRPDLMPLLRVLADRRPIRARFLLLGSASSDLVKHTSESLAGRLHFVDMGGFTLSEVGAVKQDRLWLRGGFPPSFLAQSDAVSAAWRENFVRTFLERDLPQLGIRTPAHTLRRFWTMLAHYHGQVWNASALGSSLGVAHTTARGYLDVLCGALVARQLPPWFGNLGKRIVKAPKVYVRDTGLLHTLLGLSTRDALLSHPKLGASWEGFALEQVLNACGDREAYFYGTHGGAELDLLLIRNGRRYGFEFKCSDAPTMTKSMHIARADLQLERLWVIHPGRIRYPLEEGVECLGLNELDEVAAIVSRRRKRLVNSSSTPRTSG